jgi:hypothetical protein
MCISESHACDDREVLPADLTANNAFVFYVQMNVTCHVFSGQKVTDAPQFSSHIAQRTDQWLPFKRVYIHTSSSEGYLVSNRGHQDMKKGVQMLIYKCYLCIMFYVILTINSDYFP